MESGDRSLPRYVIEELRRYTTCGDPRGGFGWLVCDTCHHHRLVPLSCKGRGFCPSCGGRRMAARAARWVDGLLPRVAVRQVVLTVPWQRRWQLARKPDLARGVLRIGLDVVMGWYREQAVMRGVKAPRTGSVTVVQRFGGALNLNVHFHTLLLDGVYARDAQSGRLRWHRVGHPSTRTIEQLVVRIADRAEEWLSEQGYGTDEEAEPDPDDGQAVLQAAAVMGRAAMGSRRGRRVRRLQVLGGRPYRLPAQCASCDGYGLHAGVVIGARDRKGLERLCRYIARPPLAKSRLETRDDGTVVIRLKQPWADGTGAIQLSRLELMERLAALVPPPRKNQVLYHGVLASRAAWREEIVPQPRRKPRSDHEQTRAIIRPERASRRSRWMLWSTLLKRVFAVDGFECPLCDQPMRLQAVVLPPATLRVLDGLELACRGPPQQGSAQ